MFKLDDGGIYSWPVNIEIPEGGRFVKAKIKARFRRLTTDRLREVTEGGADERMDRAQGLLDEVLVGWEDVFDADGQPLAFSEENKARLLDNIEARRGLIEAFWASLAGSQRAKN